MEKKPSIFKKRKMIVLVIIIVIVIAALLFILNQMQNSALASLREAPPELIALERTNLESKVTASGNFESTDPVTLGYNVQGGEVQEVYVSVGDRVYAGDLLAVLDTEELKREISDTQSEIALAASNDRWNRSKASRDFYEMQADPNTPHEQLVSASDRLAEANAQDSGKQYRSQLKNLQENLENSSIIATISGVVTSVKTEAGKAASGDMFTIENTESLKVSATIAEYDVIKVTEGMAAHITSNALGSQVFEGVVDYVAPIAADAQGNFEVRVTVTSETGQLRPGMTATMEIVIASKKDIFAVPIDAVVTKPDGTKVVYAYEPNASIIPIQQGPIEGAEGDILPGESVGRGIPGGAEVAGGPQMIISNDMSSSSSFSRREIVVTTGMETDYYIEISSDELTEGMLLLSDPEGKNVVSPDMGGYGAMMAGSTQSVTVVDAGGPGGGGPGGGGGAVRIN